MSKFVFRCFGHKNIRATHKSTLEFTFDETLTVKGDCIVGVKANSSLSDMPELMKKYSPDMVIILIGQNDFTYPFVSELPLITEGSKKFSYHIKKIIMDLRVYKTVRFIMNGFKVSRVNEPEGIIDFESDKLYRKGLKYFKSGESKKAVEYFKKAVNTDSKNVMAFVNGRLK